MTTHSPQEITRLLVAWGDGDESALADLTPLVYEELHRLAHHYMSGERPGWSIALLALPLVALVWIGTAMPVPVQALLIQAAEVLRP